MALADVPPTFQPDNEEEVRMAIAHYFRELGFEATEMSFEDKFSIQLGHACKIRVGNKQGYGLKSGINDVSSTVRKYLWRQRGCSDTWNDQLFTT